MFIEISSVELLGVLKCKSRHLNTILLKKINIMCIQQSSVRLYSICKIFGFFLNKTLKTVIHLLMAYFKVPANQICALWSRLISLCIYLILSPKGNGNFQIYKESYLFRAWAENDLKYSENWTKIGSLLWTWDSHTLYPSPCQICTGVHHMNRWTNVIIRAFRMHLSP